MIPSIPDATKAAARWIRPLVPPFVARVIDNTTQPLRTARQVFEEVEEITFSFKRTRKVTVDTETNEQPPAVSAPAEAPARTRRIESSRGERDYATHEQRYDERYDELGADERHSSLEGAPPKDLAGLSLGSSERDRQRELIEGERPRELRSPEGPRQLPPAE